MANLTVPDHISDKSIKLTKNKFASLDLFDSVSYDTGMNETNTTPETGLVNINRDYLIGGHAIFTVTSASGKHYTYKITQPKDFNETYPIWFVGVLSGPDNGSDYSYMGILKGDGLLKLTGKSKFTNESEAFQVAAWAIALVWYGKPLKAGYRIEHNGHCGHCGRVLTHPESLLTGIGPICAGK